MGEEASINQANIPSDSKKQNNQIETTLQQPQPLLSSSLLPTQFCSGGQGLGLEKFKIVLPPWHWKGVAAGRAVHAISPKKRDGIKQVSSCSVQLASPQLNVSWGGGGWGGQI